ncbi:MAG: galactose-1-phosphate uridylyltransferase [Pseudomonadota bacterium]
MSELRRSLTGRWVIIAAERANRPNAFRTYSHVKDPKETCPFCPGHEHMTPPAVLSRTTEGTPGSWKVRVIPNRFPALRIEGSLDKRSEGIYDKMAGVGAHEIVIDTADHDADFADFSLEQLSELIAAYRDRTLDLLRDKRFRYVMIFKNSGHAAGATLSHSHSQLIALPVIPAQIEREISSAKKYYQFRGRCLYCDVVGQETAEGKRLVVMNHDFAAFTPFAGRFPFEIHLLPKTHIPYFWEITPRQIESFAELLRDTLRRYKLSLKNPPYSIIIHTSPPDFQHPECYHWHVEIMPKLTETGGFEWGTGFYINPTPPEDAASHLRDLDRSMNVPKNYLLSPAEVIDHGS